jgi:hypothetical protein
MAAYTYTLKEEEKKKKKNDAAPNADNVEEI